MSDSVIFGPAGEEREPLPIADYGLLADRCAAALVGRDGSIDWLCLPRFDSQAIFGRILDPQGGHWSIRPANAFASEWRYLPGTLVLETTFTTETGVVRLTDAMLFADDAGRPHEVLRSVSGVSGEVELAVELEPHGDEPERVVVRSGVAGEMFSVRPGEQIGFSLCWLPAEVAITVAPTPPAAVEARIKETVWRSWAEGHDVSAGTHRRLARLSSEILERDETRVLVGALA